MFYDGRHHNKSIRSDCIKLYILDYLHKEERYRREKLVDRVNNIKVKVNIYRLSEFIALEVLNAEKINNLNIKILKIILLIIILCK